MLTPSVVKISSFRDLADSEAVAFAIDAQQRIVMWSPAAECLFHIGTSQALGVPCYQVFAAQDPFGRSLCRPNCSLFQNIETGRFMPHHFVVQDQEGAKLSLICDVIPLPVSPGAKALFLLRKAWPRKSALAGSTSPTNDEWLSSLFRYLGTLGTISLTPASPDLNQALGKVLNYILSATGTEAAEIFLKVDGEMILTAHQGLFAKAFCQITHFGLGEGFPGLVALSGQPLITSSLAEDNRYLRSEVKKRGFQFYECVPLLSDQGVIGCVNIASRHQTEDISSRLQFLSWVAPSLTASVEKSWLRNKDLVSNYQAEPLPEGTLSCDRILTHILEITMAITQAEAGAIALYEPNSKALITRAAIGAFAETCCHAFSLTGAIPCPMLTQNRIVFGHGSRSSWAPACQTLPKKITAVLCLPLRASNNLVGAIVLGRHLADKLWTTKHLSTLAAISDRAALAIQNIQAYITSKELTSDSEQIPTEIIYPAGRQRRDTQESPRRIEPLLDIRCFGSFQLYLEGKLLSARVFQRRKSLTALKILLTYRGRPLAKEQLIEYLWPEAEPKDSARSLRVIMHDLRQGLTPASFSSCPFITTEKGGYYFDTQASYRLDVDEFLNGIKRGDDLEAQGNQPRALEIYQLTARLYRGDFLEDENYSDWCSFEREHLQEVYLTLLGTIASLLAERGDLEGSARYLQQILRVDNLREIVYQKLMRYLWQAGRSDEALQQYTRCKQLLARELGVEPLSATKELYLRILKERGKTFKKEDI